MTCEKHVIQDGMRIYWNVPIAVRDGSILMADVFSPEIEGAYPVIMTLGPYGKNEAFQVQTADAWERICREAPEVMENTTNRYMTWETVDPEKWTAAGYNVVRVDTRGSGHSAGLLDPFSAQEMLDYYDCIEWIGQQPWCTGKVGLLGISYYSVTQWTVAALNPPHLAAICPWEGLSDYYREAVRKGGILGCNSVPTSHWWRTQILPCQHGMGVRSYYNPVSGLHSGGNVTLPEHELALNRRNGIDEKREHELLDDYFKERMADLSKIQVPVLSCGNWGGHNLHLRGNVEGYLAAGSKEKWLEMHGGTHFTGFYSKEGVALQRRFFDHYLKEEDNGWEKEPPVQLHIRYPGEKFVLRKENEWPLGRTQWTKFHMHLQAHTLNDQPAEQTTSCSFDAKKGSLTLYSDVFTKETELTGPSAVKLFVSSTTRDADLVVVLRLFGPDGKEITFQGANAAEAPVSLGWLRMSHRKLDPEKTLPYRPWHTHDELWYLEPGQIYEADVEILPASVVVPAGCRIGLTIQGHDWEKSTAFQNDAWDKRPELRGGMTTLHSGADMDAYLLLPVIPEKEE